MGAFLVFVNRRSTRSNALRTLFFMTGLGNERCFLVEGSTRADMSDSTRRVVRTSPYAKTTFLGSSKATPGGLFDCPTGLGSARIVLNQSRVLREAGP